MRESPIAAPRTVTQEPGGDRVYRKLVESMAEGALTVSSEGIVLYANPRLADMLNADVDAVIGSSFSRWFAAENRDQFRILLQTNWRASRHAEATVTTKDGQTLPVYLSVSDLNHEVPGEFAIVVTDLSRQRDAGLRKRPDPSKLSRRALLSDIEDQQQAEEELRRSEERFRTVFEAAPLGIAVIDSLDGRIYEANPTFAAIAGWSVEELRNRPWQTITHPDDVQPDLDMMTEMNAGMIPGYSIQKRYIRKDGGVVWINMTIAPFVIPGMVGPRHLAMIEDITESRRMARDLAQQEARFRTLSEQSVVGIYTVEDGKIAYMNPYGASIFGYSVDEVIGLPSNAFVADEDWPRVAENIRRRLSGETNALRYEFKGVRKDGSNLMVGIDSTAADIEGKRVLMGVVQDITARLRAEQDIRNYVARIERMIVSTVDAISNMVDLRDPYTSGHQRRVGDLSVAIAAEMGLDESIQRGLRLAGAVHDVGKLAVPAEMLSKPTRLTPMEFEIIKGHAAQGYEVLKGIDSPWPIAEVARQHHERLDGSGYPRGLKGTEILLEARILAIADVVESMASHRPYRPALGIEKALSEIERGRGKIYDDQAADACLRLFRDKGYALPG